MTYISGDQANGQSSNHSKQEGVRMTSVGHIVYIQNKQKLREKKLWFFFRHLLDLYAAF